MANQKLSLSQTNNLPDKWKPKYTIKRIGEANIEINQIQRNAILGCLQRGDKFVQIGEFTLMLNSIKSIDPVWGPDNIPPRPIQRVFGIFQNKMETNQAELDEWDKHFKNKKLAITGGKNETRR